MARFKNVLRITEEGNDLLAVVDTLLLKNTSMLYLDEPPEWRWREVDAGARLIVKSYERGRQLYSRTYRFRGHFHEGLTDTNLYFTAVAIKLAYRYEGVACDSELLRWRTWSCVSYDKDRECVLSCNREVIVP